MHSVPTTHKDPGFNSAVHILVESFVVIKTDQLLLEYKR